MGLVPNKLYGTNHNNNTSNEDNEKNFDVQTPFLLQIESPNTHEEKQGKRQQEITILQKKTARKKIIIIARRKREGQGEKEEKITIKK
jgi:hypothetical protein